MIRSIDPDDHPAVEKIFWQTSAKTEFSDLQAKLRFQRRYLGYYLESLAAENFVFEKDGHILGYIISHPQTQDATDLLEMAPLLSHFSELYPNYPAHLHINMTPETRGLGIGSQLIKTLEMRLKTLGVTGLHLLTAPDSRNRSFYEKNGFLFHEVRKNVLFMGKLL
jgi:GNAT superfamily N-acetyltransferase